MITLKWEITWTGGLPLLSGLPTWGPPPPCKQALRFDEISPRSLSSRSDLSGRNIFHLARTDLRNITNLAEFLARSLYLAQMSFISARSRRDPRGITEFSAISRLSRRNLLHIGEISLVSQKYLLSRRDLVSISLEIVLISCRSQRNYKSRRVLDEISYISPRPQSHYKCRRVIGEILEKSRYLAEFSSRFRRDLRDITNLAESSSRLTRSRRDLCHVGEISLICGNTREHAWDRSSQAESQIVRIPLQSFIPCLFALLLAVKLKPESISQGDRELIVNMTILETWDVQLSRPIYNAPGKQTHLIPAMLTISDRIQISSTTTHKVSGNRGK